MDSKGIETVRRDNCLLVKNVITTSLEKLLIQRDVEGAKEYVKNSIADLLMNRLDLSLLVITKVLLTTACQESIRWSVLHHRGMQGLVITHCNPEITCFTLPESFTSIVAGTSCVFAIS